MCKGARRTRQKSLFPCLNVRENAVFLVCMFVLNMLELVSINPFRVTVKLILIELLKANALKAAGKPW